MRNYGRLTLHYTTLVHCIFYRTSTTDNSRSCNTEVVYFTTWITCLECHLLTTDLIVRLDQTAFRLISVCLPKVAAVYSSTVWGHHTAFSIYSYYAASVSISPPPILLLLVVCYSFLLPPTLCSPLPPLSIIFFPVRLFHPGFFFRPQSL